MSAAPSNPAPEHARRGGEKHPVLARLPDVSGNASQRISRPAAPAEYVDYRFDVPAGSHTLTEPSRENDDQFRRRLAQPHSFQDDAHTGVRLRSLRSRSALQPDADLFSIPSRSLYERLEPAARFLMLFALTTAIGTSLLMWKSRAKTADDSLQRAAPAAPQAAAASFEPTLEPLFSPHKPGDEAATSSGPLGAKRGFDVGDAFAPADELAPAEPRERNAPVLLAGDGSPLPRVQTTEPETVAAPGDVHRPGHTTRAPAIARLPGIILESPSRQAQHDAHQPGLY